MKVEELEITSNGDGQTRQVKLVRGGYIYNTMVFDIIGKVEIGDTLTCVYCCGHNVRYRIESFYKFPSEETTRITCRELYRYSDEIIEDKMVRYEMS